MFEELEKINERPEPFQYCTTGELWTDEHTSEQMLSFHLNGTHDVSSRKTEFISRSVAWIVSEFNVGRGFSLADFGCGPGLYTTPLAKHGAAVTGIDFSARSIAYAREVAAREQLNINYVNQNYLEFETGDRFDLVQMIMCDFCALSPSQREGLLKTFHGILKPGGSVLLDVYSLSAFEQKEETATYEVNQLNGFWSPDRYYGFLTVMKYPEDRVTLDKFTIIEKDRIRTIYNWYQYFSPEDLEREFVEAGFTIQGLYSDVAGTPFERESSEFAVVAGKRFPRRLRVSRHAWDNVSPSKSNKPHSTHTS